MAEATKVQMSKVVELFVEEMLLQADKEATSKVRVSEKLDMFNSLQVVRIEHLEKILPRLLM